MGDGKAVTPIRPDISEMAAGRMQVDDKKVIASLQAQIAQMAANHALETAMRDAAIDELRDQVSRQAAAFDDLVKAKNKDDSSSGS